MPRIWTLHDDYMTFRRLPGELRNTMQDTVVYIGQRGGGISILLYHTLACTKDKPCVHACRFFLCGTTQTDSSTHTRHLMQAGVHIALKQMSVQPCTCAINIGVGGLHGNQFAKNRPAKINYRDASSLTVTLMNTETF